jgi:hypothetical protein
MDQQQVEQWIAQNGGTGRVQYSTSTREIDNPAADPIEAKRAGVKFDPTAPVKLTVTEEKWTAVGADGKPTGAVLHVRRKPDGNFDVVNQANPNPANAGATGATSTNIEGTPDPSKPGGFDNERPRWVTRDANGNQVGESKPVTGKDLDDWRESRERSRNPGGKTDAEIQSQQLQTTRKPVPSRPGYVEVTTVDPTTKQTTTYYEDAQGNRVNALPNEAPKPQQQPDGSWGYWDTQPGQQPRWVAIQGGPGAETKPVQVGDQWGYWKPGANGAAPTWVPIEGPKKPQIPANAPAFTPDWNKPGLGIAEYAAAVRARPDLTDEQKRELITQAHQTATSTVNQATGIVNVQEGQRTSDVTQRGQDAQLAAGRLSASQSAFGNALTARSRPPSTAPGRTRPACCRTTWRSRRPPDRRSAASTPRRACSPARPSSR